MMGRWLTSASQQKGYKKIPGIWNDAQVQGWKKIVDSVHAKGSPIFLQLWHLGRVAQAKVLKEEGGYSVVGPSAISVHSSQTGTGAPTTVPTEMSASEIEATIKDYANATRNAMKAGFDGVEVHGRRGCSMQFSSADDRRCQWIPTRSIPTRCFQPAD